MLNHYINSSRLALKYITLKDGVRFTICSLLIVALFTILEMGLYWFSLNYVVYERWVSWYFPVGMRVVAFLLLPFRYWPALMLANGLSQNAFNYFYYDADVINLERIAIIIYKPWTSQALPLLGIVIVKMLKVRLSIARLKSMLIIVSACLFYRLVRSGYLLFTSNTWLYTEIPDEQLFEMIVAHILGGFVGILNAVILGFLGQWMWNKRSTIDFKATMRFCLQIALVLLTVYVLYRLQPDTLYLVKMVAIIPIVWCAYAFGWAGAISSIMVLNAVVLFSVFGINDTDIMLNNQAFMITYSISGMLIGALVNEYRLASREAEIRNHELQESNDNLYALSKKVQQLSSKLIDVQERERKTLSQELHDEVGQNLTALKTTLKIMERKLESGDISSDIIGKASQNADHIYGSVYDLMHWLRPRALDDLGLNEVLTGSYFRDKLSNAGITYITSVSGDVEDISESNAIALFRICQEAVTNTIKHSKASRLEISLTLSDTVILTINDNGIGLGGQPENTSSGFGLKGIEERTLALGGTLAIDSNNGTSICVELPGC